MFSGYITVGLFGKKGVEVIKVFVQPFFLFPN